MYTVYIIEYQQEERDSAILEIKSIYFGSLVRITIS